MAVTAKLVKELRERTGAGMMECKKALVEANADIEKAIDLMRKGGQAKADKKASRVAADGTISAKEANGVAVLVEVNCETDFVARDDSFKAFVSDVTSAVLLSGVTSKNDIDQLPLATGETVAESCKSLINKIGEKIEVRRAAITNKADNVAAYSHGGRIAVIVELEGGNDSVAKDVAMHIAASNPLVISAGDVPEAIVEKEKEIFIAQAQDSGKPANIIEKMIEGKIRKFLDEQSLEGQSFIKDPSQKVGKLLKDNNAKVISFTRFAVGEGIEKEEVDFAAEVMSQVHGA
jgi:elongation factor Ts